MLNKCPMLTDTGWPMVRRRGKEECRSCVVSMFMVSISVRESGDTMARKCFVKMRVEDSEKRGGCRIFVRLLRAGRLGQP